MVESRDRSDDAAGTPTDAVASVPLAPWPRAAGLIVLSGGASRRLGRDKATTHVGGRTVLDRILQQIPDIVPIVLVGPPVPGLPTRVTVVREAPPGGGPLAAVEAGLQAVSTPLVGVLAADMPFAVPLIRELLQRLSASPDRTQDALVPIDVRGHRQPLCAGYRTDRLAAGIAALSPVAGRPVRAVLPALRVVEWPVTDDRLIDIDTATELRAARARAAEEGIRMEQWLAAVQEALGLDLEVDLDTVLDVARDAAHHVERPAAPLTTYLLGAAVARGADPHEAAAAINQLAVGWADRPR